MGSATVTVLTPRDPTYPEAFTQLTQPPDPLYLRGSASAYQGPLISVVGSRMMSAYGQELVRRFVPVLVRAGLGIVSGLAYGVDAFAHRQALAAGGTCVAVLGSGIERITPAVNRTLAEEVVVRGCLLSEFPPTSSAQRWTFPVRNRLIAALSPFTLIIEAGEQSGTLTTAAHARDLNREVAIIPGDITRSQSQGIYAIYRQGAHLVTTPEEVIALYAHLPTRLASEPLQPALTGTLAQFTTWIAAGFRTTDSLAAQSGLPVATVQSLLSVLEVDGYIYYRDSQWFQV